MHSSKAMHTGVKLCATAIRLCAQELAMCNSNKAVCTGVGYVHSSKAVYIGRWMLRQYYQDNERGLDPIKDARMSQSIHTLQHTAPTTVAHSFSVSTRRAPPFPTSNNGIRGGRSVARVNSSPTSCTFWSETSQGAKTFGAQPRSVEKWRVATRGSKTANHPNSFGKCALSGRTGSRPASPRLPV
jgi:hypothetical protein